MDLANNFVVSLAGASETVRYANVVAATSEEAAYLVDEGGSIAGAISALPTPARTWCTNLTCRTT